jgi:hypothetical protein
MVQNSLYYQVLEKNPRFLINHLVNLVVQIFRYKSHTLYLRLAVLRLLICTNRLSDFVIRIKDIEIN